MPDSPKIRQRRYAWHRRGDHSLCRPEHCAAKRAEQETPEPSGPVPGSASQAVESVLAAVVYRNANDRRLIHAAVARKCGALIDATGQARDVTALSEHLAWLLDCLAEEEDPVVTLQASSAAKLGGHVPHTGRGRNLA